MAIRGPQKPGQPPVVERTPVEAGAGPRLREGPQSPTQRLMDFGMAKTPTEAQQLVQQLLQSLSARGFPVPKAGSLSSQLEGALKQFQQQVGLPVTGKLDAPTKELLVDGGHLPPPPPRTEVGADQAKGKQPIEAPTRFEIAAPKRGADLQPVSLRAPTGTETAPPGSKSARGVEVDQAVDKAQHDAQPTLDLRSLLGALRLAGFAGAGKGSAQLKEAVSKLQQAEGLPASGKLDDKTLDAMVRRGALEPHEAHALKEAARAVAPAADRAAADGDKARVDVERATSDPSGKGVEQGDGAQQGKGDGSGTGKEGSSGGAGNSAKDTFTGVVGRVDQGDPGGQSDDVGNAHAGDQDEDDERRGEANRDHETPDEVGHWRAPKLSQQIEEALANIVRDDDGHGAATYAWDVTLVRPGIYSAGQPAERLFHLVVDQASAFHALWEDARAALNDKLRVYEPDAEPVSAERLVQVLRRARVRTVDAAP